MPETVWEVLWSAETYPQWTRVFAEGSQMEGELKAGSLITFHDGKGNGVQSLVEVCSAPNTLHLRHQKEIKDGELKESPWKDALEAYHLREESGTTVLNVEMDITEETAKYFDDAFPKALELVKQLAESR